MKLPEGDLDRLTFRVFEWETDCGKMLYPGVIRRVYLKNVDVVYHEHDGERWVPTSGAVVVRTPLRAAIGLWMGETEDQDLLSGGDV